MADYNNESVEKANVARANIWEVGYVTQMRLEINDF